MVRKPKGGYMPYTDYCINSSRLINKIYELENRIVNLKRLGLRLSKKK